MHTLSKIGVGFLCLGVPHIANPIGRNLYLNFRVGLHTLLEGKDFTLY